MVGAPIAPVDLFALLDSSQILVGEFAVGRPRIRDSRFAQQPAQPPRSHLAGSWRSLDHRRVPAERRMTELDPTELD
jgi:hypothetical protein